MANFQMNLAAAARRHNQAAECLYNTARKDVAGYIFGLAAECAFKELMRLSGMARLPQEEKYNDPFFAHFEQLKSMARDRVYGRNSGRLRRFCDRGNFMQFWDITMRYSDGKAIEQDWINRWRKDASEILAAMDEG